METQTPAMLLSQIEALQNRLAESEQLIEAIKAGEVDAFAITTNNKAEVFTLQSGDYAYRVLIENLSEGALNLSENGLIVYTNIAFYETLKLPYEKVIGQNIIQFIHPDSVETFQKLFKKGLAGQSKGEINLIVEKKSCPVYISLTSLSPALPTVGVIVSNLTEKKQALKELEVKKSLQNIFQNVPAATAVFTGPKHKLILANKAYEKLFNRKAKDLLGKNIREVFPELIETGAFDLVDYVFRTGESFYAPEYASTVNLNNGDERQGYFNFSMEPLKNDSGEIYAVIAMIYPITEQVYGRKKVEENEKQKVFLLKLSDVLRPLSDPVEIEGAATKISLDFMGADRCYYSTLEEGNAIVLRDTFREGLTSLSGVYPISNFPLFKAVIDAGRPFIVDDVYTSDIIEEGLRQICVEVQVISMINVPVIKNGKSVGVLSLVQSKPRTWTGAEVQLTIETAERTWAAIERAKVGEALRKSEEKYRTLFTSMDQGFTLCELIRDKEGKGIDFYILEVNPTYEIQTGVSKEMVVGKPLLEVFPSLDKLIETYAAVVDNQHPVEFEQYFEDTDRWFAIKAYPVEKERFAVLFSNITERKQAEEIIKESESRFRGMADASPVLIWTLDALGGASYYNKTFLDFIGASKDEDISDWEKIVHPDDFQAMFEAINRSIAKKSAYASELRLLRADGQWRWVMAQGSPRLDTNNEFLGFVGSSVDITERKQFESELMEAKTAAENAAKSRQQFLSNMSHEIRTPLNSILGFTNVLFKTELGKEQKEYVQAIKTSGKSLNLLINDILDLAKVDAGKMTFEKQPFEMQKSVSSILHSFDLKLKEKNLVLVEEYDSKIPSMLLGDSVRLNQILFNLVGNAIKFTHKGEIILKVKVLFEDEEDVIIELTVTDSGIGIPADKLNSIFNLFEQAELSTSTSYGGTGLGLAIVKKLVEEQGGTISVQSKPGEGSTFSLVLPFGKTDITSAQEIEMPTLKAESQNLRVLVAEDVALNQLLIKIILSDFGFEYELVGNGKLAIEKMKTHTFDIILMDLQMPEMNGYEATEYIRKTLKSQIPIVALTADVTTADVSKCKEFGMDDYISKPISENLLYSKIMELVQKKR